MNVALYLRVSTLEQKEKGYSLSEQRERLEKYCEAKGWNVARVYEDGGFSGASLNRPQIQKLMHDCSLYDLILVWKLDRLSRSQKDTLFLIDHFKANDTAFASMQENFDTSSAFGMAMVGILSVFAQLEREQIRERSILGRAGRAKQGKYHGGRPPLGYDYDKTSGKLVPSDEAHQIKEIYELYLNGMSQYDIAKYCHDHFATVRTPFNNDTIIRRILKNPVYIGVIQHKGEYLEGCHEPIIERDIYDRVQAINQKNVETVNRRHRSRYRLLSSRVYCECGQLMRTHSVNSYNYYECYGSIHHTSRRGGCGNRIRVEVVEDEVKKSILSLKFKDLKPKKREKVTDNAKELAKIDRQISKLVELYSIESIPIEEVKTRIDDLKKKKSFLTPTEAPLRDSKATMDILSKAKETFDTGDVAKSQLIANALVEKVIIGRGEMEIYWTFA